MNGPVLAFRNPKPTRRLRPPRAVATMQRKFYDLFTLDRESACMVEDIMDSLIERRRAERPGNIGKPVITIDGDDREGA